MILNPAYKPHVNPTFWHVSEREFHPFSHFGTHRGSTKPAGTGTTLGPQPGISHIPEKPEKHTSGCQNWECCWHKPLGG